MPAECALYTLRGRAASGGKVPLPSARSTPFGVRGVWRQGAAAGCALYALRGRAAAGTCKAKVGFHPTSRRTTSAVSAANGGKVPLPGTRSTPFGVARRLIQTGIGWFAKPFTRRTISAASAANECEGITCLWQVTRNIVTKPNVESEAPPA